MRRDLLRRTGYHVPKYSAYCSTSAQVERIGYGKTGFQLFGVSCRCCLRGCGRCGPRYFVRRFRACRAALSRSICILSGESMSEIIWHGRQSCFRKTHAGSLPPLNPCRYCFTIRSAARRTTSSGSRAPVQHWTCPSLGLASLCVLTCALSHGTPIC